MRGFIALLRSVCTVENFGITSGIFHCILSDHMWGLLGAHPILPLQLPMTDHGCVSHPPTEGHKHLWLCPVFSVRNEAYYQETGVRPRTAEAAKCRGAHLLCNSATGICP